MQAPFTSGKLRYRAMDRRPRVLLSPFSALLILSLADMLVLVVRVLRLKEFQCYI
jgi:hypothetical protein